MRLQNKSLQTERTYIYWIKKFSTYVSTKTPAYVNQDDAKAFLSYLVIEKSVDPRRGIVRRHHVHESSLQKAVTILIIHPDTALPLRLKADKNRPYPYKRADKTVCRRNMLHCIIYTAFSPDQFG